jgi:hypothetical protein
MHARTQAGKQSVPWVGASDLTVSAARRSDNNGLGAGQSHTLPDVCSSR